MWTWIVLHWFVVSWTVAAVASYFTMRSMYPWYEWTRLKRLQIALLSISGLTVLGFLCIVFFAFILWDGWQDLGRWFKRNTPRLLGQRLRTWLDGAARW